MAVFAGLLILVGALALTVRFGVMAPPTLGMIEARTDGLAIGRLGNLKIEGLRGDLFRSFSIERLTISDEEGVWLEARNIEMTWRYLELLRRRFHAESLTAEQVSILRRPTLTEKKEEAGGLPVTIVVDRAALRLALSEAFSYERGLYDVTAQLRIRRQGGGQQGEIHARSLLHEGDRLDVVFDIGERRPLLIDVEAVEAQGGAIAGALGLPADEPFRLAVEADGRSGEGRFEALARTGGRTPLQASGRWNADGAAARGQVSLTASDLTRPIAARVGPEVTFDLSGQQVAQNLYEVTAGLAAENLRLAARGRVNPSDRSTGRTGLLVVLSTDELSQLTGAGDLGAARLSGALKGELSDLTFAGELRLQSVGLGEYGLRQVSGPVQVARDRQGLRLEAELRGAGGAGEGYLAALLGQSPTVSVSAERRPNGRLLLRNLEADGAGLDLDARGSRGLLGGMRFQGEARLSNLSQARAGAQGALGLDFTATHGSDAGDPWTLTVEAQGRELQTGYAQLDHLLGPRPDLRAQGDWGGGRFVLESARLRGANLQAQTAGVYGPDGDLAFKIDWSAEGPLGAGPVEISGEATGTGAITGSLGAPMVDLMAEIDEIDVPRLPLRDADLTLSFGRGGAGAAGRVTLTAASQYGPARARADFALPESGVNLSGIAVSAGGVSLQGDLALRRATPSRADLELVIGPGALLQRGQIRGEIDIVDGREAPVADLELVAEDAVLAGTEVALVAGRLTAQGPIDQLPYQIAASGAASGSRFNLEGRGALAEAEQARTLTFIGEGGYGGRDFSTRQPAVFRFGDGERSARLTLVASDGGEVEVDARLAGNSADIRAEVEGIGLSVLNPDFAGRVNAVLVAEGRDGRLDGTLSARMADARGVGSPRSAGLDAAVEMRLSDDVLLIEAEATNEQGLRAEADLRLPTEASAKPFRLAIARREAMSGRVFADGDVKPLWDLLVDGDRSLAGRVRLNGTIAGSLADPSLSGQAALEGGRFEDFPTGLVLQDLTVRAALSERVIDVSEASAVDGEGGRVQGSGRISLYRGGVSSFQLRLNGFRLIENDLASADASGTVTINRNAEGKVRLAGDLTVDEAEVAAEPPTPSGVVSIDVVERNRPLALDVRQNLRRPTQRGEGWALDVNLDAPRGVFIRGRGLDVEMSLDAHVTGTTSRPRLEGVARVVRGDYEFAGKRFEFDERGVVYLSTSAQNIRLDLSATREDPSLTATIRVSGTAAKPEIALSSSPSLPDDEILSQVLFGRSAAQLSTLEAAQLAAALSSLAGGGGFDVVGNLRELAGLDRLSLGGTEASGVTVAGGKYLTDDVYLEIIGGGREGAAAQVEWRVRRNLSIVSRLTGQGDTRLAVRWRKDY
ncbi:MAG: translocation/assembly module TamB domain-containing protein [Phenylobacterium sp.]|uniref:translocation/assembly module TamB domain-containing protein n=2 Tax=Phenylobacterium sp. TaxID=1871053 RepID=UPI0039190A61